MKYERLAMDYELKDVETLKFADDLEEQIAKYKFIFEKYNDINVIY